MCSRFLICWAKWKEIRYILKILPILEGHNFCNGSQYEPDTSERRSINERNAQTSRPKVHWTKI